MSTEANFEQCGASSKGWCVLQKGHEGHHQSMIGGVWSESSLPDGWEPLSVREARRKQQLKAQSREFLTKHAGAIDDLATPDGPQCGIAGCEGDHDPQDHNTITDEPTDYLHDGVGRIGSEEAFTARPIGALVMDALASYDMWQGSDGDDKRYEQLQDSMENLRAEIGNKVDCNELANLESRNP